MQRNSFKGYKLDFSKKALKDLGGIDQAISKKIYEFIRKLNSII